MATQNKHYSTSTTSSTASSSSVSSSTARPTRAAAAAGEALRREAAAHYRSLDKQLRDDMGTSADYYDKTKVGSSRLEIKGR